MSVDIGEVIGLVSMVGASCVLIASHVGAYLLGQARAKSESKLPPRETPARSYMEHDDRMLMLETALTSMAHAIEQLSDAQRRAMAERIVGSRPDAPRLPGHNTPA